MGRLVVGTNLLAGGAAAALLVVLVFVLDLPLWLAALLAVATFAAVVLIRPGAGAIAAGADRAALERELRRGANVVAELRRLARDIPTPAAKGRVLAVCDSADRILAVLQEDRPEPETAASFVERYLLPANRLIAQYARVADRGLAAAAPALAKIEESDLPLLDRKLRELYDGLHRGDVIDLEVASEMLEFDLVGVEPAPSRRLQG